MHSLFSACLIQPVILECANEYFLSVLLKGVTYFSTYSVSKTPNDGNPIVLHLKIEGSQFMRSYVITTKVAHH